MSYSEIAETLERFVVGKSTRWEWDDFMATNFSNDPYLSQLHERLSSLDIEFPPTQAGAFCSPEGIGVMRNYAKELRSRER